MGEPDKKDKQSQPNWQLQFAFYLSIVNAVFAVYQFIVADQQSKIDAAVEIGRKFFEEGSILSYQLPAVSDYLGKHKLNISKMTTAQSDKLNAYIGQMDYVGQLANANLIDKRYLPAQLICSIYLAKEYSAVARAEGYSFAVSPNADKFVELRKDPDCSK